MSHKNSHFIWNSSENWLARCFIQQPHLWFLYTLLACEISFNGIWTFHLLSKCMYAMISDFIMQKPIIRFLRRRRKKTLLSKKHSISYEYEWKKNHGHYLKYIQSLLVRVPEKNISHFYLNNKRFIAFRIILW